MSPHLVTFRVHYSLTGIDGVQRLQRDIDAVSPGAAEAVLVAQYKPRIIVIGKVKRLKAQPAMPVAEQIAHGILFFGFGFCMYLALIARTGGF